MKLNSLAFRLFATAAVWTLLVLPLAGLRHRLRPPARASSVHSTGRAAEPAADPNHRIQHRSRRRRAALSPQRRRAAVRGVAFGLVLADHAARARARASRMMSASLASEELALPSAQGHAGCDEHSLDEAKGPLGEPLRIAETVYTSGDEEAHDTTPIVVAGNLDFVDTRIASSACHWSWHWHSRASASSLRRSCRCATG